MTMTPDESAFVCRTAIIGVGPRGLVALENLLNVFSDVNLTADVECHLFDSSDYPGAGPNYAPDQLECNQLNVPLRTMPISRRSEVSGKIRIPSFPSFEQWYRGLHPIDDSQTDHFPPRAQIGLYLQERLAALLSEPSIMSRVTVHSDTVVDLLQQRDGWSVQTQQATHDTLFDDVLVTVGHQPTKLDASLETWSNSLTTNDSRLLFVEPYPNDRIVNEHRIHNGTTVALRGMGLSMIDVVKSLTIGRNGKFEPTGFDRMAQQYYPSGEEPRRIVPFSLDGQPMAPKPVNEEIDERFRPSDDVINSVEQALAANLSLPPGEHGLRDLLIELACHAVVPIFQTLHVLEYPTTSNHCQLQSAESLTSCAQQWLLSESFAHPTIVDRSTSTVDIMHQFLEMAHGIFPPSLDYCLGQVWKHLQPSFYRLLSFRDFEGDVIASAIELDQRLKRYAFGPPAEAIARLIALCDVGILQFRIADDPDIALIDKGWQFTDGADILVAQCLVNSVLSPPDVALMDSALVNQLKDREVLKLVHDGLGARAKSDSQLVPIDQSVAAAGRLIYGTVFEADALVCCFGEDLLRWASGVASRQTSR